MRRARAVWLLDSADPSGAAVMAMRRMHVLRDRLTSRAFALAPALTRAPAWSPLHAVRPVRGLAAESRIARADVVITTSARALTSAGARLTRQTRLIHFLHDHPHVQFRRQSFMRRIAEATTVVVPLSVDPEVVAKDAGLRADQVIAMDDFTLPHEALLSAADRPTILTVGRLPPRTAVLDLVAAFRLAELARRGWQLRIAGWGPGLDEVREAIARHRLAPAVLALGARHDIAQLYLDAGLLVRLDDGDVAGLSVLEALAAGVPVLAAETVPAAQRHVGHGRTGRLLTRTDPTSIAHALTELAGGSSERADLAATARAAGTGLLGHDAHDALVHLINVTLDSPKRPQR